MKQFVLRFEDEAMLAALAAWADEQDRSTHAQILSILRKALAQRQETVTAGAGREGKPEKPKREGRR